MRVDFFELEKEILELLEQREDGIDIGEDNNILLDVIIGVGQSQSIRIDYWQAKINIKQFFEAIELLICKKGK